MNDHIQSANSVPNFISAFVYYLINTILFPVTAIGYIIWSASFFAGSKSGMSGTAQAPLISRWYQHQLGVRQDEPAFRLMQTATKVPWAMWLTMGPTILAYRVSGYVPKQFRYPFQGEITLNNEGIARQTFFDHVLAENLSNIVQFVNLGAGFDTRALNLPKNSPVQPFEIDTPGTLDAKREMLRKVGVDSSHVIFVPANFEKEDWYTRLIDSGFDPNKRTLFIWEGVVPYLNRESVEDSLRKIASTAKGNILAFDYFTNEVLESPSLEMRSIRASLKAGGEPLKFGFDSTPPSGDHLAEFLNSYGFSLFEQKTLGRETSGKRAWGGFAIVMVK